MLFACLSQVFHKDSPNEIMASAPMQDDMLFFLFRPAHGGLDMMGFTELRNQHAYMRFTVVNVEQPGAGKRI